MSMYIAGLLPGRLPMVGGGHYRRSIAYIGYLDLANAPEKPASPQLPKPRKNTPTSTRPSPTNFCFVSGSLNTSRAQNNAHT